MNKNLLAALAVVLAMIGCTYWIHRQNAAAHQEAIWAEEDRRREEQRRQWDREDAEQARLQELRRIREELEDQRFR
jgi:hypothetical protein